MSEDKLCKDCVHAKRECWYFFGPENWMCHGPHLPKDLVNGGTVPAPCSRQRSDEWPTSERMCGPSGKFFKRRKPIDWWAGLFP